MDKNRALERIRFILDTFKEIDLAYVFGSFLERDDFRDIDVAIHLCKEQSPYQRFKLSQRVARDLEHGVEPRVDFDIRILNYAPAYFQYEVISKGTVVLERDKERRIDFEAHLISEYLDLKYMYDGLDKACPALRAPPTIAREARRPTRGTPEKCENVIPANIR